MNELVAAALDALARHFEVPQLALDPQSCAALEFADGLRVNIRFSTGGPVRALVAVELAHLPDRACAQCEAMLALNGRLLDTQGASFALDPRSGRVLVLMPFEEPLLDAAVWPVLLEALIDNARRWREPLVRGEPPAGLQPLLEQALERANV